MKIGRRVCHLVMAMLVCATAADAGEFDNVVLKPAPPPSQPAQVQSQKKPVTRHAVRLVAKHVVKHATAHAATSAPKPVAAVPTVPAKVAVPAPTPAPASATVAAAPAAAPPPAVRDTMMAHLTSAPPAASAGPALAGLDASAPLRAVTAAASSLPPIAWEGQLRYRYEARSVLDYRVPGAFKRPSNQSLRDAGDVSIMRTRLGANLKLSPGVKAYFNLQDARTMGAEGSPGGTLANVDLYLAYVDLDSLGGLPLGLRAGRQVLTYGDGRLVSGADWGNAGRGYDGARLRFVPKGWQVDGFVTWISEGRLVGQDRMFSGADALWRGFPGFELEGYDFMRSFGDSGYVSETGRKGSIFDATAGGRARYQRGRVEAKVEGALQRGRRAGDDVRAWFGVGRLTVDLPGAWKPRALVENLVASGDRDPTDGISQRFDPLYWGGHNYQGALDIVAAANVRDWCGGLIAQPRKAWTLQSEFHDVTLLQAKDYWTDDSGTSLRRDVTGAAGTDLGRELDLTLKWDARARVSLFTGWSHFWMGEYVKHTGGGRDVDWGFLQMAVGF